MMSTDRDARLRHRIEFEAGAANSIMLSDTEAEFAKEMLQKAESALDTLDRQLDTLWPEHKEEYEVMERQCGQAAARVERLSIALAPHKRLPTELLSYIFTLSAGDSSLSLPPSRTDMALGSPWVLRKVCSRWRLVALSERSLWNFLSMDIATDDSYSEKTQLVDLKVIEHLLPIILPKIGSLSLYLCVNGISVQRAFDAVIAPCADRITDLYLGLPGSSYSTFFAMLPNQFTSLKNLDLEFLDSFPAGASPIPDLPPSMRHLSVAGDSSPFLSLRSPEMNLGYMTDLDISQMNVQFSDLSLILKRCTNLKTCRISVFGDGGIDAITLPFLHYLMISLDRGTIFDDCTLPSLKELHVSYDEEFPGVELASMLRRSACLLEIFSWDHPPSPMVAQVDAAALSGVFAACPSITDVAGRNVVVPRAVLDRIKNRELLPKLEILECRVDGETVRPFVDAIMSRAQGEIRRPIRGTTPSGFRAAIGCYPQDLQIPDDLQDFIVKLEPLEVLLERVLRLIPS
ncbi:hypothetical protein Hypma_003510 [Hypsizygus marmoreus]|uniref:Uncharacterized protein n=1 Tax=Hypsizygus marmoreus TaxID=39966 RepID=A0A369J5W1_HYPMA|nr:hypothetical protein Hypma_003510 [Hypsizygus marmoreus]